VVDVDSHEELDEIMAGFPFGPFSTTEVYALSDLDRSLAASRSRVRGDDAGGRPQVAL
jgi:muconolactone delta-isomerase